MTYESAFFDLAEKEKSSQSTFFERKIMSTKTAFKRVALVAAAALAIGGVSAVSAQAVGPQGDWTAITALSSTLNPASPSIADTASQIAGPANYVALTDAASPVYITVSGGTIVGGTTAASIAQSTAVNIATPTVGTITVTSYAITAGAASTTATGVLTITVVAAVPQTVYASTGVYGNTTTTQLPLTGITPAVTVTDVAAAVAADATFTSNGITQPAGAPSVANFQVVENDSTGLHLNQGFVPITATVTNGLIQATGALGTISGASSTYLAGTPTGVVDFTLSGIAGLAGTATVTIAVNGIVVRTFAATFTGTAVKIVLTAINSVVGVGAAASLLPTALVATGVTANTNALEVQEFDANGNAVSTTGNTITVTPASSAVATTGAFDTAAAYTLGDISGGTTTSPSVVGVSVNGVAAGTTTFTATDSTNTLTSAAVSVRVSGATPTTVVLATDSTTYAAGGAGTLTTTLSDAAGTVPAGTYVVFTGQASASYALTVGASSLPGAAAAVTGNLVGPIQAVLVGQVKVNDAGVYSSAFNAPISDATGVTVSATASATTITVTPAMFDVSSGASAAANAATDAANEATDAANAATDAANAAADSADAATQAAQDAGDKASAALAAVTALSIQVTTVLAKVAALSALLVRIIKKVKA